ncbi:MAG: VOC family protein [Acidimicrobiia bacterium]
MLTDAEMFSGFAVADIAAARDFYQTTLGLDVVDVSLGVEGADVPGGLEIRTGRDVRILVYPKADHEPAVFTILNFIVDDIEQAVDELSDRGVRFEHYDSPKTDAQGIHRTPEVHPVAWFRDPAGNLLSLIER